MGDSPAFRAPLVEGTVHGSPRVYGMEQAFSAPQTPGGALSVHSGMSRGPDLAPLNDLVGSMKGTLDHLGGVFDSLGEQCVYAIMHHASRLCTDKVADHIEMEFCTAPHALRA